MIKVRVVKTPAMWTVDGRLLTNGFRLSRLQSCFFREPKVGFSTCPVGFVDELYFHRRTAVIPHLSVDKDTVAGGIVPDVHTERLDAHLVGLFECHRTEDAKRLTAFGESPFGRTTATHPRHISDHFGMGDLHAQAVSPIVQPRCDIQCVDGAAHGDGLVRECMAVEHHPSVGSDALEVQEILPPGPFSCLEGLGIDRRTVQISVLQLPIAVIVVPVVRQVYGACGGWHGQRILVGGK